MQRAARYRPVVDWAERFAAEVASPAVRLDLAWGAIAAQRGSGSPEELAAHLDDLAGQVSEPDADGVRRALFDELGFRGAEDDYAHPDNSDGFSVLERRRGLPISLAIVAMEVARRVGVGLDGIGTPAHFLIGTRERPPRYIDGFRGGLVLDRDDLERIFARIAPDIAIDDHLAPLPTTAILHRVLNNLVAAHQQSGDRMALRAATDLRTRLPVATAEDRRAHAAALALTGGFAEAADALDRLVAEGRSPDPDADRADIARLRARLN